MQLGARFFRVCSWAGIVCQSLTLLTPLSPLFLHINYLVSLLCSPLPCARPHPHSTPCPSPLHADQCLTVLLLLACGCPQGRSSLRARGLLRLSMAIVFRCTPRHAISFLVHVANPVWCSICNKHLSNIGKTPKNRREMENLKMVGSLSSGAFTL